MLAQCNAVRCGRGKEVAAAQKIQISRVKSEQRRGSVKPARHGGEDAGQQPRNGQLTCTDRDGGLHFIAVTINLIPFF